jgi:hypothetical protein
MWPLRRQDEWRRAQSVVSEGARDLRPARWLWAVRRRSGASERRAVGRAQVPDGEATRQRTVVAGWVAGWHVARFA